MKDNKLKAYHDIHQIVESYNKRCDWTGLSEYMNVFLTSEVPKGQVRFLLMYTKHLNEVLPIREKVVDKFRKM